MPTYKHKSCSYSQSANLAKQISWPVMIIAIAHNQMLEWAGAYRGGTPTFTDLAWQMDLQDWVAGNPGQE